MDLDMVKGATSKRRGRWAKEEDDHCECGRTRKKLSFGGGVHGGKEKSTKDP